MAEHRHKRETPARRRPRAIVIAGPLAVVATLSAVSMGVLTGDPGTSSLVAADERPAAPATSATVAAAPSPAAAPPPASRVVSRSGARNTIKPLSKVERLVAPAAVRRAVRTADDRLWTTEDLNLWSTPGEQAVKVGELEAGEKVLVTGRTFGDREEIVVDGKARWVSAGYLSDEKPPTIGEACTNGTSVASGVSANVTKVHQAVCAAFPEISTYGTFRSDGEHGQGLAVDIMISGERGWEVAEFVREHHVELGVSYLIYAQKIWSVERAGEGWRAMENRGSATANHFDHVHVTTY